MALRGWTAGLAAMALAGGAWAAEDAAVKALMETSVNPAALAFWAAGNDPPEDETPAQAEARWQAAEAAARTLQADAVRMAAPEMARAEDWTRYAAILAEAGAEGARAIAARDTEAAFAAGGRLYEACDGCHKTYIPRPQ